MYAPASIAGLAYFMSKKMIWHSLSFSFLISLVRLSYIIFETFIRFSESACGTDRPGLKNTTQNTASCFIQCWLVLVEGVLTLFVTIVSTLWKTDFPLYGF